VIIFLGARRGGFVGMYLMAGDARYPSPGMGLAMPLGGLHDVLMASKANRIDLSGFDLLKVDDMPSFLVLMRFTWAMTTLTSLLFKRQRRIGAKGRVAGFVEILYFLGVAHSAGLVADIVFVLRLLKQL